MRPRPAGVPCPGVTSRLTTDAGRVPAWPGSLPGRPVARDTQPVTDRSSQPPQRDALLAAGRRPRRVRPDHHRRAAGHGDGRGRAPAHAGQRAAHLDGVAPAGRELPQPRPARALRARPRAGHALLPARRRPLPRQPLHPARPLGRRGAHRPAAHPAARRAGTGPARGQPRAGDHARPRAGDRAHRRRQVHDHRRAARADQPARAAAPRRDGRGPDRVRVRAEERGVRAARGRHRHPQLRARPARGAAPDAERHLRRRDARPRQHGHRACPPPRPATWSSRPWRRRTPRRP